MLDFELIERKPTAEELIKLRETVGWGILDKEFLQNGLDNSLYGICASDNKKIIGTARVVGDGFTVFYIQDVIVNPKYQRMGIGIVMMTAIMKYINDNACGVAVVGLMSAKVKEEFYQRFGFWKRANENFGVGMMQFWERSS